MEKINNNDLYNQLGDVIRELNEINYKMLGSLKGEARDKCVLNHMEVILKLNLQRNRISQEIIKKYDFDVEKAENEKLIKEHFSRGE